MSDEEAVQDLESDADEELNEGPGDDDTDDTDVTDVTDDTDDTDVTDDTDDTDDTDGSGDDEDDEDADEKGPRPVDRSGHEDDEEPDPDEVEAFMDHMRELRRTRLRTGAHRWSLYRDADRPYRITEFMVVADWDEHLAQHARIDTEAAEVIRRSRAFDRADGPVTRHLAGLDILASHAPPIAEQLITVHEQLHAHDGSTPLDPHDADAPSGTRDR